MIPVVVYGVKSSPDEKASVQDQHRIVLEAVEREGGREVVRTFGEANQSGYRKERGPELEAAMRAATDAAAEHGDAELWVWHSSRLARGDGTRGKRSIAKLVHDLRYQGVAVRSATDAEMVTPMLAGIASTVSNKYSEDLSGWTRAGLERRRKRGEPLGALPGIGYEVERRIVENRPVSRRIISPTTGPFAVSIFERVADGQTPGAVARWLNDQGVRSLRGALFTQRTIRKVIANDAFVGGNGYPRIVSDELAARARAQVKRLDPAEIQRRKGGRRPHEPYMLRSLAFCADCGAPLYRSYAYLGGKRAYVCANKLQATGACQSLAVPAEMLESRVLEHLDSFVGSVQGWIAGLLRERGVEAQARQRQLDTERAKLAALDRQREERMAELERVGFHPVALEVVERIDRDRAAQAVRIADAEAKLAEFDGHVDANAALDFYNGLVETVQGRLRGAHGVAELNEALGSVLAGLWCHIGDGQLHVDFVLRRNRWQDGPYTMSWVCSLPKTEQLTTVSACWP